MDKLGMRRLGEWKFKGRKKDGSPHGLRREPIVYRMVDIGADRISPRRA